MGSPLGPRCLPILVAAVALNACGGGGGAAPAAMSPAGGISTSGTGANTSSGNVQLSITLPGTTTASKLRKPAFVSGGTAGVLVTAYASTDTAHANPVGSASAAVGLGAPGCSSSAPITCLVPIGVPPSPTGGSTAFVVTLYNQAPANGVFPANAQVLGIGNASQVIVANGSNALPVSVLGMPASVTLAFQPTIAVQGGIASLYSVTVTAVDAASQPIQGAFASPLQLTTTNSAITSFTVNGQPSTQISAASDSVAVSYNGGAGSANLSLTGTAANFTATTLAFIPSSGAPTASPSSVTVDVPFGSRMGSFTVSEPNYTGAGFTESDNCATATSTPTTIALTSLSGATATYTITAGNEGGTATCTATIVDTVGQTVTVMVTVRNTS